jgi:hypothetical protein
VADLRRGVPKDAALYDRSWSTAKSCTTSMIAPVFLASLRPFSRTLARWATP